MFRKILIAFVFLAILSGLSYLKTSYDFSRKDALVEKAKTELTLENQDETDRYTNSIDSLGTMLASNESSYNESLDVQKKDYETQLDSLEDVIDLQSAKITTLDKKIASKTTTTAQKKRKPKQLSQHEKIYRYYKKRYTQLPQDLSSYEQKIALSEIREETASKFTISLSELSKIRKEYKLNY